MITNHTVDMVSVSQHPASPAGLVAALFVSFCGSLASFCTSVASCEFDLSPPCSFISDKNNLESDGSHFRLALALASHTVTCVCVRQCAASGRTALSYLEPLCDKAQLHRHLQTSLASRIKPVIFCVSLSVKSLVIVCVAKL